MRNLVPAGVDRTVAMKISGHRTDSTFRRYNITSEDDLRDAVEKVAAYVDALPTERKVAVIRRRRSPGWSRFSRQLCRLGRRCEPHQPLGLTSFFAFRCSHRR